MQKVFKNDLNIVTGRHASVGSLMFEYTGEEPITVSLKPSCSCINVKWKKGFGIEGKIHVLSASNKHVPHQRSYVIRYEISTITQTISGMLSVDVNVVR